jgi:hypothetical protein
MLTKGQNIGSARTPANPDETSPKRKIGGVRKTAGTLSGTSYIDSPDNSPGSNPNMEHHQNKSMFAQKKYQTLKRDANAKLVDRILSDLPDSNANLTSGQD